MASTLLNVPTDIPWTLIDVSEDMMDRAFCDGIAPTPWRSSIALYAYQPAVEDLPTELCSQRVVYLKVSCTATGFQASPDEADQVVSLQEMVDDINPADLEEIAREYLACYGVLLNIGVFPSSNEVDDLTQFPHIIDFEPKVRDLYQAATTAGEILTSSTSQLNTTKAFTSTESTQNSWKGGANVSVPLTTTPGGPTAGMNAETGQIRTDTDQQNWQVSSEASRERKETQSTTTQLSQMYNLLTGYHAGTNKVTFLLLPRPHVLEPTDRRTFVQGLREIEGLQDFFLVVLLPKNADGLRVETVLSTGHFPEVVDLVENPAPADQFETKTKPVKSFNKRCVGVGLTQGIIGSVAHGFGGDQPHVDTVIATPDDVFDGFEVDGWEFDRTQGDSGHAGISEAKEADDTADATGIDIVRHGYRADSPDKVSFDITVRNKAIWPDGVASNTRFHRSYSVHLRKAKGTAPTPTASLQGLLITQRELCTGISLGKCIAKAGVPTKLGTRRPGIVIDEPTITLGGDFTEKRPHGPGDLFPRTMIPRIQRAMIASANRSRHDEARKFGYLDSTHFQRRLARVLPKRIVTMPVKQLSGLEADDARRFGDMTVSALLLSDVVRLAKLLNKSVEATIQLRASLVKAAVRS